jgi:two-component system copper resistance phosphate regulon response regulator CusR
MRILLVEDEKKSADYIRKGLTESGFGVDVASRGVDGLHLATQQNYDLAILDIMLPDIEGWTILQTIRTQGRTLPVLLLTARDGVADRVRGLDMGADDYLVKPFAFSELLARIRALLRRGTPQGELPLTIADLTLDVVRHKATRAGLVIDLTAKEMALLALLVRQKGQVLSRTLIAEQVWDSHFDCDSNVIDVAIRRLRSKVDDPFPVKLIKTVRGLGYAIDEP